MFYLVLVLLLLAGGVLTVITIQNLTTPIHLMMFVWQTPDIPAGFMVLCAVIAGALLLYMLSVFSALQDRQEVKKLRKRVAELESRQQAKASETSVPTAPLSSSPSVVQMPGMFNPPKN